MTDENNADGPEVKAENNSVAIGRLNIGGEVSGQINIAGGHIIYAEKGSTVNLGAPAEAVSGLAALHELTKHSPDVRTAVIAFQTDFKVAHEQVDVLGDYKDLHDLLHQLQFRYNCIVRDAVGFPADERTLDSLSEYAIELEGITGRLRDVAGRPKLPKQELTWIEDISLARDNLYSAIEALDRKSLYTVTSRLNRVLALQPPRINTLLNHAARTLRLPDLLEALTRICNHISSLELDADQVLAFQSGLNALESLNQTLSELVEDHDRWQFLDVELRRIGASIDRDSFELEMTWPDIKHQGELLYGSSTEQWAEALQKERDALDATLASNDSDKVRRCFQNYQRRVADRFFRVDVDLKALCGDLRQIGVPLASVLRIIQ